MHMKWNHEDLVYKTMKDTYGVDISQRKFATRFEIKDREIEKHSDKDDSLIYSGYVVLGLSEERIGFYFDIETNVLDFLSKEAKCIIYPDWEHNTYAMKKYSLPQCSKI